MKPFDPNFNAFRGKTTGSDFEDSLTRVLLSTATTKFPKFAKGVLAECNASVDAIKSASTMRRSASDALRLRNFANNRERFAHMFAFDEELVHKQSEGGEERDTSRALSDPPFWALFAGESDSNDEGRSRKRKKRTLRPKPKSIKREPAATETCAAEPVEEHSEEPGVLAAVPPARNTRRVRKPAHNHGAVDQDGATGPPRQPLTRGRETAVKDQDDTSSLLSTKDKHKMARKKKDTGGTRGLGSPVDQGPNGPPQRKRPPTRATHVREVASKEREDPLQRGGNSLIFVFFFHIKSDNFMTFVQM